MVKQSLTVASAEATDVHKDVVRIHWSQRDKIANGTIVKLAANGKERHLVVRGLEDAKLGQIQIDFVIRDEFDLKNGEKYEFEITKAPWLGQLRWAMTHSDPGIRVATWIAFWSAAIGTLLGIAGLLK